jgi:hypothetical protein
MPLVPTLASESGLAPIDYAALVLGAIAVLVEAVADQQLATFVRSRPPRDAVMQSGLWAWSRHPNYLGEVGFWWALALLGVGAGAPSWTLAGAGAITALFVFISIPMMEKRSRVAATCGARHLRPFTCRESLRWAHGRSTHGGSARGRSPRSPSSSAVPPPAPPTFARAISSSTAPPPTKPR